MSTLSLTIDGVMRTFPKAFKGSSAAKNTKLIEQLLYSRGNTSLKKIKGLRNGIVVLEEPFKENFKTTTVREFLGLNENGKLISLKNKAIYKCNPSSSDPRSISAMWSYNHKTGEATKRQAISVAGKLKTVDKTVKSSGSNNVAGYFYDLSDKEVKLFEHYDFNSGKYSKLLRDPSKKLGLAYEHGSFNGGISGPKLKEGSVAYSPNLGILGNPWGTAESARTSFHPFSGLLKEITKLFS